MGMHKIKTSENSEVFINDTRNKGYVEDGGEVEKFITTPHPSFASQNPPSPPYKGEGFGR